MGSLSINGAMSICPDPDYVSYGVPVKGAYIGGRLVRQGWESGTLRFPPLNSAMRNELYTKYAANQNALVSGALPQLSGYGWQSVSADFGEPIFGGFDGEWAMSGTMLAFHVIRY